MGAGLTRGAHERIRRHLALIPAYVWLVDGWRDILAHMPFGPSPNLVRDFVQLYVLGLIGRDHDAAALYDVHRWEVLLESVLPSAELRYPPYYPPQVSVLFAPIAWMSYRNAMAVWMLFSLAAYLACAFVVWRACPRLHDRAPDVWILLLGFPGLLFVLSYVQMSAIALICVTGAFAALRGGRPLVAGLFIGSLAYKPQLGIAAAVVLVAAREWRVVIGAITGAAAQLALAAVYWGPSMLVEYIRAQVRNAPEMKDQYWLYHLHSWRSFFEIAGLPDRLAMAAYAIAAGAVLIAALWCWRSGAPLAVRFSVLLVATVLVNPHMYVYDVVILMPAFLLLWDWCESLRGRSVRDVLPSTPFEWLRCRAFTTAFAWLLYFCYLTPRFALFTLFTGVQLSVPALTLLGVVVLAATAKPMKTGGVAWPVGPDSSGR